MTTTHYHTVKDANFHISKAERNESFYNTHKMDTLDSTTFNEWSVVVLFYILMHYIDAILSQDTSLDDNLRDPIDHATRNKALSQCSGLTSISSMYLNLYNRSRDARYTRICFPNDYLNKLETISFKPVRQYLRNQLGLPQTIR